MQALILKKTDWETSKGFELVDIPKPTLEVGDEDKIIIKVHYAGVCGTDKGIWNRMAFKEAILNSIDAEMALSGSTLSVSSDSTSPPKGEKNNGLRAFRIIGHEFFGEVVEIGSAVNNIKMGDMVACESHVVCNECLQCLNGQKNVCTNEKILGISVDGGFAEFAKVPSQVAWKVDTGKIRPEVAVLHEPFGNAVHAGTKVEVKGKTVAVFGLGPIGSFLVLVLKGLGAKTIIGIEPNEKAIAMGKELGVDYIVPLHTHPLLASPLKGEETAGSIGLIPSPRGGGLGRGDVNSYTHNKEVVEEIMKTTNGLGVDVAFEMAGFNSSVNNAIASVRRGGEVILFGLKTGDFVFEDFNKLVMKGITLHCVAGRQLWQTWETTQKLFEDKNTGVQDKLFEVILQGGQGTILNIQDFTKEKFEEMLVKHPKFLIKF